MKMRLSLVLLLAGCATPYQPLGFRGGYSDRQIGSNKFLVEFDGNGFTSAGATYNGALRRAEELCNGDFEVLNDRANVETYEIGKRGFDCQKSGDDISCDERQPTRGSRHGTQLLVRCAEAH